MRAAKICASYIAGLLPPEFRPALRKIMRKERDEEIESLRTEVERLKEKGDVWTINGTVEISSRQMPLRITVNTKDRRIEHVEADTEAIKKELLETGS
jgi:hypothetical protein